MVYTYFTSYTLNWYAQNEIDGSMLQELTATDIATNFSVPTLHAKIIETKGLALKVSFALQFFSCIVIFIFV